MTDNTHDRNALISHLVKLDQVMEKIMENIEISSGGNKADKVNFTLQQLDRWRSKLCAQ